ncbi:MAG: hemerythrin domain-containing protein [Patescibacteria group bacterium]|nr:hemerythrin domain-containing protein [Patescibacteria group bacterium]
MAEFNSVEEIKEEHRVIWNMLDILESIIMMLEKGRPVDIIYLKKVVDFLTNYIDRFHQAAEEKALLPVVLKIENFNGKKEANWILTEHGYARDILGKIAREVEFYKTSASPSSLDIVNYLREYQKLYRLHVAKENNLFFDLLANYIKGDLQDELNRKFLEVEKETLAEGKKKYYDILKDLKQTYLKVEL